MFNKSVGTYEFFLAYLHHTRNLKNHTEGGWTISMGIIIYYILYYVPLFEETREF